MNRLEKYQYNQIKNNTSVDPEKNSRNINILVAVLTLLGTFYTIYISALKDIPNLHKALKGTEKLQIDSIKNKAYSPNNDKCLLTLTINLKNVGYNNIHVDSIETQVLQINPDINNKEYKGYIYVNGVNDTNVIPVHHYDNQLIGYYPPEVERKEDFYFVVPIKNDTAVLISTLKVKLSHFLAEYLSCFS